MRALLGSLMTDQVHPRREALAGGEEGNGIELWRALHWEYEGGATACHIHGVRSFHNFPKCKDIKDLAVHIGEWQKARAMYASNMPPDHVTEFFLDILPEDLKLEIHRRRELVHLNQIPPFVQSEIARLNDKRIAATHDQRRKEILGSKH